MNSALIEELKSLLSTSDAKLRKHWAERVLNESIPASSLMSLLHADAKTAQRFTWFIGDLLDADTKLIEECLPLLFSLNDQMPFPGMRRCVGKCFYYCGVPKKMERDAIPVLVDWLGDDQYTIGAKHYAAKVLYDLVKESRYDGKALDKLLRKQEKHPTSAHASRMAKMRVQLQKLMKT